MPGQLFPESAGAGPTYELFFMSTKLLEGVLKVIATQKNFTPEDANLELTSWELSATLTAKLSSGIL